MSIASLTAAQSFRDLLPHAVVPGSEALSSLLSALILPQSFSLSQNCPNPFNPETAIRYDLPVEAKVSLFVYDIGGQRVRLLVDEEKEAGRHTVVWDGKDEAGREVASGIYLYRLRTDGFACTRKMALIR